MGTGILKLMKNASHSCCSFSTRFIVQKKPTEFSPNTPHRISSHTDKNRRRAHKS